MNRPKTAVLLGALFLAPAAPASAQAQSPGPAARLSQSQGEVLAVDLKQGMTLEDVQKLLGKPRRTTLSAGSGTPPESRLQWTYSWGSNGFSEKNLQVVFASKSPERWYVTSWDWSSY